MPASSSVIADLRARIYRIERSDPRPSRILQFGVPAIDNRLPARGLQLGTMHECAGGSLGAVHAAAAVQFVAGILARIDGPVLWCIQARDLFEPALSGAGLHPDRVIYAEVSDEKTILSCMEEGLRHSGLAGVVGEVSRLTMTNSRRLQLAAEVSGTTAFVIRRWRSASAAVDFGQPTAAATRWRITAMPSSPLPVPGVGRARWWIELIRVRAGECADWELEACDAQGRLALSAGLADRPAKTADGRRRAFA